MIMGVVVLEDSSTSQLTLFPFVLRLQFYFLCVFALKPVKFGKKIDLPKKIRVKNNDL